MSLVETMRKQKLLSFTLLLFTLSIGIVIGTLVRTGASAARSQAAADATPLTIPDPVQMSTAFSQLAKKLEPSVVNITTDYLPRQAPAARNRRQQPSQPDQGDQSDQDLFQRFLQDPFGNFQQMPPQRRVATGSGVIVDAKGYILTNNHVVDEADRITVRLDGDTAKYEAKLIGRDVATDLAVIKIDAPRSLPPAKIGNSDAVEVGDWAVAIGSPFGLEATVTAGIISAKGRDVSGNQFQHFLQTDAAINPGNSGGPLLNIKGEVIGINTAIATNTNGYQGVGFALPINTAVQVYNQIIKTGRMTRGSIGVSLETNVTPELLKVYGASEGAFVKNVQAGSPAEKAGLKEGDVIASVNGKPVKTNDDLITAVAESPVGSNVAVGVLRDGKKMDMRVAVGDRTEVWRDDPRVAREQPGAPSRDEAGGQARFGISGINLRPADRASLGTSEKGGVRVTTVDPASFADDIGMEPGDIITAINRQPVNSFDDLVRIQNTLKPGDAVAFRVLRNDPSQGRGANQVPQRTSLYLAGTLPNKD
jgi:serine protease Do